MSLRTEEVCRENEAGTESTRHSPGGYIVPQRVRALERRNDAGALFHQPDGAFMWPCRRDDFVGSHAMSALGHSRRFHPTPATSGLPR
jgi:hypothetical protein